MSQPKKTPDDGRREPQDVTDAELETVSGGRMPAKPLNPQPLPPIAL